MHHPNTPNRKMTHLRPADLATVAKRQGFSGRVVPQGRAQEENLKDTATQKNELVVGAQLLG